MSDILSLLRSLGRTVAVLAGLVLLLFSLLAAVYFPHTVDDLTAIPDEAIVEQAEDFYEEVYSPVEDQASGEVDEHKYVQMGQSAGESFGALDAVGEFVERFELHGSKALEVGAGSGQLQDLVEDYTGLDIAASAKRYFHKPFVHGSATALPFADDEFDAVWTVWVLEHVPNPELALQEMRRVVRPGGLILLAPAWNCNSWNAQGYAVRPYSDFAVSGKLIKASLPLRNNPIYQFAALVASRAARRLVVGDGRNGPTRLHYRPIEGNFDDYWVADADAINSIDPHEAMLWHTSRGDECLNCPAEVGEQLQMGLQSLIIRVHKPAPEQRAGVRD